MHSGERADNPNYWKPYDIMIRHLIGSLILGVNKRKGTYPDLQKRGAWGVGRGEGLKKNFLGPSGLSLV